MPSTVRAQPLRQQPQHVAFWCSTDTRRRGHLAAAPELRGICIDGLSVNRYRMPYGLDDSPPLYLQIATQMAGLIRNGSSGRGSRMPLGARARPPARRGAKHGGAGLPLAGRCAPGHGAALSLFRRSPACGAARTQCFSGLRRPREVSVDWLGQRILGTPHSADVVSFSSGTPGPDLLDVDRAPRRHPISPAPSAVAVHLSFIERA